MLAGLPLDNQYWFAYEAIKKEWSVRALDEAIKLADSKKSEDKNQKPSLINQFEQQLTEHVGYPIKVSVNKNLSGYFRIPSNNQIVMQDILAKWGYQGCITKDVNGET